MVNGMQGPNAVVVRLNRCLTAGGQAIAHAALPELTADIQ